ILGHIYSTWIMCLVSFCINLSRRKVLLVYSLQLFHRIYDFGIELDESSFRSMIILCNYCGPMFAIDSVKIYNRLLEIGVEPNALTYGHYLHGVKEAELHNSIGESFRLNNTRSQTLRNLKK